MSRAKNPWDAPPAKSGASAKSKPNWLRRAAYHPVGKAILGGTLFLCVAVLGTLLYFYMKYAAIVDDKLARGPYSNTSKLYGAPQALSLGDEMPPDDIIAALQRSGYTESRTNRMGWFHVREDGIEVFPGVDSYFDQEAHVVKFNGPRIAEIISLKDNTQRTQFWLEPELITNLFDRNREKRRILRFDDIPKQFRNALLAAEDKRFFNHTGFDPFRVAKSAWVDLKSGRNSQGASTLSMQLARSLLLTNERSWRRKFPEIMITMHLERVLSKEEIFEHYSNQIYLGRVGSFNIHGFGEGAQVFFGKDLRKLDLAESAALAGIVQSPSNNNPFRNPERTVKRRNLVLGMMRDNQFITAAEYESAIKAPLVIRQGGPESEDAPYFVDLVNDELLNKFQDHDFQANSYRVYTSLDPALQRVATEAMRAGLKEVDDRLLKMGRTPAKGWPKVQSAMVAIDARTGELKALIGGRDYAASQLNRALAKRPSGSIFKPFVYAAALSAGLNGGPVQLTPASRVNDEPTTFWFSGKAYEPNNYKGEYHGSVTMRQALAKSMNIPAIKFAEQAGFDRVAQMARRAGMSTVQATPAAALGSYDVQPLEIAGSYTAFTGRGVYTKPYWIKIIRDQDGNAIHTAKPVRREALDARVAFMVTNLLEDVMRSGTGAGARGRGFGQPAAGKTGTSHDGWFAGYTTELITVVWVGYDDYRELGLEGAWSALPIWTEFMKRAHKLRPYRRAGAFSAPDGVVQVDIDAATGKLAAGGGCGGPSRLEVFLAGTQPLESCSGGATQVAGWEVGDDTEPTPVAAKTEPRKLARRESSVPAVEPPPRPEPAQPVEDKKGIFGRIRDLFK